MRRSSASAPVGAPARDVDRRPRDHHRCSTPGGTSDEYVREDYPRSRTTKSSRRWSPPPNGRLRLPHRHHDERRLLLRRPGTRGYDGYRAAGSEELVDQLVEANVKNIEMEASAICTLANLYGLRAGAVCTVYADRDGGEFATKASPEPPKPPRSRRTCSHEWTRSNARPASTAGTPDSRSR